MSLECPKCEDNFCCVYLGQRRCSKHCQRISCFCIGCQLYNIEEKSPSVYCQKCSFLSECYSHKYLGKVNGRDSYILQRHCIDHCQIEGCPHRDEVTVRLERIIPTPNYSHLIRDGDPSETINVQQQVAGPERIESGETPVPSGKANPRMVPRVPKKDRSRSKGVPPHTGTGGTRGSVGRLGRSRNARAKLSAGAVVGTRSTNRPCYRGM